MHIEKSYKYELDEIVYVSGSLPEGANILEEMNILTAEEGYTLYKDGENIGSSVWLKDGDSQDNYEERKEDENVAY